jgi:CubicO group peptidase (beta-lactamase class C family)
MNRRKFLMLCGMTASATLAARAWRQSGPWGAAASYNLTYHGVSLLVLQRGKVLFDQFPGSRAYELASGTKSFWGVVACLAAEQKLLQFEEELANTLTEWRGEGRGAITIRQLLTLTSGLQGGRMGRPPSYLEALETQQVAPAGRKFQYGPAPFQVFGELLRRKISADPLTYLQQHVFDPAGVTVGRWKRDAEGMPHLPSGAALTAADWARFGVWVMAQRERLGICFQGTSANPAYGLTWWLKREADLPESFRPMRVLGELAREPAIPSDLVMAAGAGDQRLYLIPSRELVIVRQANRILRAMLRDTGWSDAQFLKLVLASAAS